ncbi:MAG: hypothetical protein ACTHJ0_16305 [Flavipsychrobacter sp.]
MLRKTLLIVAGFILFFSSHLLAQDNTTGGLSAESRAYLHAMEDSLITTADSMYTAYIPDTRPAYCERFVRQLIKALKVPDSYKYPFDSLGKKINIMYPDDNSFRIFNWNINPTPVTSRYYGAIQMPTEQLKLYPMIDYSEEIGRYAEDSALSRTKWYGALYYRIITHEVDGKKIYTLFGLNASSPISNKKVMDPLVMTDNGPVFGAQIFNINSQTSPGTPIYRFIIEYKKEVQASMNWDDDMKVVYFDKLVSQVNDPNRKYTYVPSGQYDGFKWQDDQWKYVADLIPVQPLKDGEAPSGEKPFNAK